jgi:hypothetical protein
VSFSILGPDEGELRVCGVLWVHKDTRFCWNVYLHTARSVSNTGDGKTPRLSRAGSIATNVMDHKRMTPINAPQDNNLGANLAEDLGTSHLLSSRVDQFDRFPNCLDRKPLQHTILSRSLDKGMVSLLQYIGNHGD